MKLIKNKTADVNYLSKIVNITEFRKHNNPEVERLKCCSVDGFNIITGIDSEPGLYVYFPALSCINGDFLSYANLFRKKELNKDSEKTGMFDDSCRVKAIKLKGEISEGFILPVTLLENYAISNFNKELENVKEGTEFNAIQDSDKEAWVSKKYTAAKIFKSYRERSAGTKKVLRGLDRIIDSQFHFHYSTVLLKKCPFVINPESLIQISYKIHGTSFIVSNILCHKPLTWKEKIAKWLTGYSFDEYGDVYASRSVVKNRIYGKSTHDVWAEVNKIIYPKLTKGQTVYGEIVGFLPSGTFIQKKYDYGCVAPEDSEKYTPEKHFKIRVYRITYTNVDGDVLEYTPLQVQQWCQKVGLIPVEECYFGKAKDLYPDLEISNHWNDDFINRLSNDKNFFMECNSPHCKNKVPHEGLVIKPLNNLSIAYKLKTFAFINGEQKQLDKGESNIEDES